MPACMAQRTGAGLICRRGWIDSTAGRAIRAASGAGKKGLEEPQDHALGRSWGGLINKIHMLCDANGIPLRFLLSGGNASDINYAQPLPYGAHVPTQRDRSRKCYKGCLQIKATTAKRCASTTTATAGSQ